MLPSRKPSGFSLAGGKMLLDLRQPEVRRSWAKALLEPIDEARWAELTRELFAWQFERGPAYRRLCGAKGVSPASLKSWKQIPAVPQQLFKRDRLYCDGLPEATTVYETSGTTTGQPGRQYLLNTAVYRTVSVEGARREGLFRNSPEIHFLTPSPNETPHSSLSAMFGFWREELKAPASRFWARGGQFDFIGLRKILEKQVRGARPIAIAGTAFAFVHLLDAWTGFSPLRLPPGSWLLETGGFKGRSREVAKPELYALLARLFTLPDEAIWNEYGMSELSSQAYAHGAAGLHRVPPWTRVVVCDPATGREVRIGARGLVRWFDLANTDSVFALQTLDLAERTAEGFLLLGRMARAEPRGCSLGAEDLAARLR